MSTATIEVPDDLRDLLARSHLGSRSLADQVKLALVILLFQDGVISIGKAAEMVGEPRPDFERLLVEVGIPPVRYELPDYEQDLCAIATAEISSASA